MALKIPKNFDYKLIDIDPLEKKVRDELGINIESWAKFRHAISLGIKSSCLVSNATLSEEVKTCYLELGKSHYEAVTMLGATKISADNAKHFSKTDKLLFRKSFKEFYMHAGSVLDNLARLIYIVNIRNAPTALDRWSNFKRHTIGFGGLNSVLTQNSSSLKGYSKFIKSKTVNEIKTLRNNFTHSWPPTFFIEAKSGDTFWPTAMRKKEQYYLWPHDHEEAKKVKKQYRKKVSAIDMINEDWLQIEKWQNYIFGRLTKDIVKFEQNHNLRIT